MGFFRQLIIILLRLLLILMLMFDSIFSLFWHRPRPIPSKPLSRPLPKQEQSPQPSEKATWEEFKVFLAEKGDFEMLKQISQLTPARLATFKQEFGFSE